jgi:type IV secretion system protein VirB1
MSLDPAAVLALAARCAPGVAAETLLAVAKTESGLNPYAIGVNRGAPPPQPPQSPTEAAAVARRLLSAGANLDLGLAQINSANLARLRLTVEGAFDPCRNLAAAAQVLAADYGVARTSTVAPQAALRTALSLYNTGDDARGFRNGYVTRVVAVAAGRKVPAPGRTPRPTAPRPPTWDTFGDLGAASFVVSTSSAQGATP